MSKEKDNDEYYILDGELQLIHDDPIVGHENAVREARQIIDDVMRDIQGTDEVEAFQISIVKKTDTFKVKQTINWEIEEV